MASIEAICERYGFVEPHLLARGGQGEIYGVFAPENRGYRVVKIPRESHTTAAQAALRHEASIQREAATHTSRVPRVHNVLEESTSAYIVMDYVGSSLYKGEVQRVSDAIDISIQVAEALDVCHGNNLVHGDVKPSNICVNNGTAFLIDFGASYRLNTPEAWERLRVPHFSYGYTAPELLMGTAAQFNRDIGDVFSLGSVVYELLTGEAPYARIGPRSRHEHLDYVGRISNRDHVSLHAKMPGIPARLSVFVDRMLAFHPYDRPASMSSIVTELREIKKEFN